MKVRIYKSPDGVGKVVNKTAQWMAQMGGVQAAQVAMNPPIQQEMDPDTENQIVQLIVPMINEEPSTILNDLVTNKGIPLEIAQPVLLKVLAYKKQKEEADAVAMREDSEEIQDVAAQEKAIQEQSQNDLLVQQMMMQPNNMQDQYADEDQLLMNNIMAYGGVKKNSYVKNVMKLLKKQQGDEVQGSNIADDTDTGARKGRLSDFISTMQNSANEALMKQDAESMYEQEFRRGGTTRQQRQINRGLNQIVRSIPMMPPMGIMGAQNIMSMIPATGMIPGGIKTANIQVEKTGLFGKPKKWNASFTYNEPMNPNLYRQMLEQDEYNTRAEIEEDAKDYAQERVDTATDKNEAVQEKTTETKTDDSKSRYVSSATQNKPTGTSKPKSPVKPSSSVTPEAPVSDTPVEATGSFWDRFNTPEAAAAYQEGLAKMKERQAKLDAMDPITRWYYENVYGIDDPRAEKNKPVKSYKYATEYTDPKSMYYDAKTPGVIYGKEGDKWYAFTSESKDFNEVKDPTRIKSLNTNAKGADLFTLPSKPGYYYRQRGDGSFVRFKGDPNAHVEGKKSEGVISPKDPNYAYLNKAKKYTVTYTPKKQIGGFVDPTRPELNRFIYGGDEPFSFADDVPMKDTTDPYFRDGGLNKYQTKGETRGDWERSQGIKSEPTPQNGSTRYYYDATWDGEKWVKPAYKNNTTNTFGTDEIPAWFKEWAAQNTQPQIGMTPDDWRISQGESMGINPHANNVVWNGTQWVPRSRNNQQLPYNNPYIGNYNMFNPYMMQGYGQPQIYPPLFGGRGFRPPGRFLEYAGSWMQQQGLPTLMGSNMPYMGSLNDARIAKINIDKTGLSGRIKKGSIEYDVPTPTLSNAYNPKTFYRGSDGLMHYVGEQFGETPATSQQINTNIPGARATRSDDFMQNMWERRAQRKGYDVDWSTDGMVSPNQQSSLLPPPQFTDEELGNNQLVDVQPEIFAPSYSDKELGLDQIVDVQPESFNMRDLQSMGYNITPEDLYNERLADENQAARQAFDIEQMNRAGRTMPPTPINVEDQNITPQTPAPVNTVPVNNTPVIPTTGVTADSVYTGATESSDEYCFPGGACYSMPEQLKADQRLFQELPEVLLRQDLRANKNWITDNNQLDVSKLTREDILEALMAEKGSPNAPVKDIEQYPNLNNFIDKWLEYQKGNQAAYGDYGVRQLSDESFRPNTILTPPYERYSDWLNVMGAPSTDPNDIWENQGVLGRRPGVTGNYKDGGYLPKAQFGMSDCPPGYFKDPATGLCKNFAGEFYNVQTDRSSTADNLMQNPMDLDENYVNPFTGESPAIRMGSDGQYVNEGLLTDKDLNTQRVKADFKIKDMVNANFLAGLNKFNFGMNAALSGVDAFRNRQNQEDFYANLPFNYQSARETIDRGWEDTNTGQFTPNKMGQIQYSKKGGSTYKKDSITYLSSQQVQDLMKKGYKIEFIQ